MGDFGKVWQAYCTSQKYANWPFDTLAAVKKLEHMLFTFNLSTIGQCFNGNFNVNSRIGREPEA